MLRSKRAAFTLLEMAVVIVILVIAILLIAYILNQKTPRQYVSGCMNNQRNLALAISAYVEERRAYPGYRNRLQTDSGPIPVSWFVEILPYAERSDLYELWKSNPPGQPMFSDPNIQNPMDVFVPFAVCPNDLSKPAPGKQPLSYVVNAGLPDAPPSATTEPYPADWPANGIFMDRYGVSDRSIGEAPDTSIQRSLAYVTNDSIRDGLSNTLLLSESVDARYYYDHGTAPAPPGFPAQPGFRSSVTTPELYTTMVWHDNFDPSDPSTINPAWRVNGQPPFSGVAGDMDHARPSSNHPGIVVVTFCDGRTQHLSEWIDYKVFCLLMTSYGRKANPPGTQWTKTMDLPVEQRARYEFSRKQVLNVDDVQ